MKIVSKLGRPSKYTQELQDKADDYIMNWKERNPFDDIESEAMPTNEALCMYLNIGESTLYDWSKEEGKEAFSDTLKRIKTEQKFYLYDKGLKNMTNPVITKMKLAINHGEQEKQVIEQTNIYDDMSEDQLKKIAGED